MAAVSHTARRILVVLFLCLLCWLVSFKENSDSLQIKEGKSLGRTGIKRGRMNEHIAFFYNPSNDPRFLKRLNALHRVISAAETYTELYSVDVAVHTNRLTGILDGKMEFDLVNVLEYKCTLPSNMQWRCPNVTLVTHDMEGLHPHFLTWMHRKTMLQQNTERSGYYDVFLYVEDDQLFTLKNLEYWREYAPIAKRRGCRLGFLRIPDPQNTAGFDYFCGPGKWGSISKDIRHFSDINNSNTKGGKSEWALLGGEMTYWAGWIMDRTDFESFASSPEYLPPFEKINKYKIREIAAWGWDFPLMSEPRVGRLSNGTVVPLLPNGTRLHLHPGAKTYHLSEKGVPPECREGPCKIGVIYENMTFPKDNDRL